MHNKFEFPASSAHEEFGGAANFQQEMMTLLCCIYRTIVGRQLIDSLDPAVLRQRIKITPLCGTGFGFREALEDKRVRVRVNPRAFDVACYPVNQFPPGLGPFLGLAHELIHVLHFQQGLLDGFDPSNPTQRLEEEYRTVGLGIYLDETITENALRHEMGLAYRLSYDPRGDMAQYTLPRPLPMPGASLS
ncbi:hypothetical protein A9Q99_11635 [Gammaproteobacteria bacterium 45_16_T64]|nr:hypothetical protein A9Q99_11635 [Gammaproteobacteria bacterium 45_16_T64]